MRARPARLFSPACARGTFDSNATATATTKSAAMTHNRRARAAITISGRIATIFDPGIELLQQAVFLRQLLGIESVLQSINRLGQSRQGRRRHDRFRRRSRRDPPPVLAASQPSLARRPAARTASYGALWLTPAADEMTESDWKFPGRAVPRLCAGADGTGQRADLYRAERRPRRDRIQIAKNARIQELAADPEHRRMPSEQR